MKTLNSFTIENHPELNKDIHVPEGTDVLFKSWFFDGRTVSGLRIVAFDPHRAIDLEIDAGFLFSSMTPISIIATMVKFNNLDIVQATLDVDNLFRTRIYSLKYGV